MANTFVYCTRLWRKGDFQSDSRLLSIVGLGDTPSVLHLLRVQCTDCSLGTPLICSGSHPNHMQHTPTIFEYSAFQAPRPCTVMKSSVPHFCETDENDTYLVITEFLYKGFTVVLRSSTYHAPDYVWMLTKPSCHFY